MVNTYLLKYNRKAILCLCADKDEFNKLNQWIINEDNSYRYGFSKYIEKINVDSLQYMALEILDRSRENIDSLVKGIKSSFNTDLNIKKISKKSILNFSIESVIEDIKD